MGKNKISTVDFVLYGNQYEFLDKIVVTGDEWVTFLGIKLWKKNVNKEQTVGNKLFTFGYSGRYINYTINEETDGNVEIHLDEKGVPYRLKKIIDQFNIINGTKVSLTRKGDKILFSK